MEPGGNDRRRYARDYVLGHASHQFGPDYPDGPRAFHQDGVRRHLPRVGQLFELYRGLTLVIYAVPATDNGAHSVEKPPSARRHRAGRAAAGQGDDGLPLVLVALDDAERIRRRPVEGKVKVRDGHAPGLFYSRCPARHRDRDEVAGSLVVLEVSDQDLASPEGAIVAVAEAVKGNADDRAGLAVVGQAGDDVGVVVLYSDQVHSLTLEGVLGREVLGVEIVGHSLGVDIEQPAEVLDAVTEGPQRLVVLEVADMV